MDLQPNKTDVIYMPITNTRISASEWNQLVGSCMAFITEAGLTPDAADNEQFLNAFKTIAADLELVGANTNLSNLTAAGESKFTAKADTDLSNLTATGQAKFDDKANTDLSNVTKPYVTETYVNGTSWYRVWSDGWCEQGGVTSSITGNTNSVELLKTFADTSFTVQLTAMNNVATTYTPAYNITSASTINIGLYNDTAVVCWRAEGYLASGD